MGCCGGNRNNQKMKEWGSNSPEEQFSGKQNFTAIVVGLIIIVLISYQFIIK